MHVLDVIPFAVKGSPWLSWESVSGPSASAVGNGPRHAAQIRSRRSERTGVCYTETQRKPADTVRGRQSIKRREGMLRRLKSARRARVAGAHQEQRAREAGVQGSVVRTRDDQLCVAVVGSESIAVLYDGLAHE